MKKTLYCLIICLFPDLLLSNFTQAQTNPCPEISNPTITSSQSLSLFNTSNSDRQFVYLTAPNEILKLLSPNGLWVNGTCWYRIKSPEGVPYPDLWLGTQPEKPSETPLSFPSPSPSLSLLSSPSPDNLSSPPLGDVQTPASPQPQQLETESSRISSAQVNPTTQQQQTVNTSAQNSLQLYLLVFAILAYFSIGSFLGIITFLYSLFLSNKIKKLSAQNQELLEEKLTDFSQTIVDLEKRLISQLPPPAVDPLAIDLEITNLLRKKGPMSLSSLTALSPHDPDLLQQRLDLLQQESLVKKQALNDTEIYSLFALTPAEQQLVTLILVFNQQHLTYFQEQRSQPLNLKENTSPRQLEKAEDLATAHYLMFRIEAEHWLIPNILSPEIAQIMRHLINFPDLFKIIPGSGSLYLIKPAKLYPLEQDLEQEFWGIAEIGEFQWLNPTT